MFAFREAHKERDARVVADLRDEHGARIIAGRRARKGAITEGQLREQLAHDLNALLNTINMETGFDLAEFPHVRESILNYGIPISPTGRSTSTGWPTSSMRYGPL